MPSAEELETFYSSTYYQAPVGQYQKTYDDAELAFFRDKSRIVLDFAAAAGVTGGRTLDLGCGEGYFLREARDAGFQIWGMDNSSFGLTQHNPGLLPEPNFVTGDVLSHRAFPDLTFDLILCRNVTEHVIDPDALVQKIADYLSPTGVAVIDVPNDFSALHDKVFAGLNKEQMPFFCPPQHLHYFNVTTLRSLVERAGLKFRDGYGDYPIDHLLLEEGFDYYKDKSLGRKAHSLRRRYIAFLCSLPREQRLEVLRAGFNAGLGRNIAVVFSRPAC